MVEGSAERRLAAIVAIDVAGYSRLMGADEDGTLAALKGHREATLPLGQAHGGRIVGTAGDGELWEFPSVTQAVTCAIEVQALIAKRNAQIPDDRKMLLRIGINLGDVMIDEDDIFGDRVNVAARIEALAKPGGICVSRSVRDNVRDRLAIAFEDLDEVEVKNIARPVRVFRVLAEGEEASAPKKQAAPKWIYGATAAVVLILLAVGGGWWWSQPDTIPGASIAILPFANLSGDKEQDYFADGIAEDITTDLSKVAGLRVTSRSATLRFRGSTADPRRIAADLKVGHILAGSVRRAGERVRITAKLIDGASGDQLWAERFDRETKNIFAIQDEIAERVVAALSQAIGSLSLNRAARAYTPDIEAYDLYIQGRAKRIPPTPGNLAAALAMFERAIRIDPTFAGGYAGAAFTHVLLSADSTILSDAPSDHIETALRQARKAVELDPGFGPGWGSLAEASSRKGLFDEVFEAIQNAMKAAPSDSLMRALYGRYLGLAGQPQEGIAQVKQAMAMSPDSLPMLFFLGINYRAAGDFEKAIEVLVEHRNRLGGRVLPGPTTQLIAAYVQAGRLPEARAEVNTLLGVAPHYATEIAAKTHVYKKAVDTKLFLDALRTAGLPDHPPIAKPEKPAIAVLPFINISDDKAQEYFADGMTDDLITDLSKVSALIVIARNSVFTYKGKNVKVQEIAKDLNVTHVLEGSVQRAGGQVRINAQLIDAKTGAHLWAETFDRDFRDVFKLQDELSEKIVAALKLALTPEEKVALTKPPTEDVQAYEHYLKAESLRLTYHWNNYSLALAEYRSALKRDPAFVAAHLGLAKALVRVWRLGWTDAMPDPRGALLPAQEALAEIRLLVPSHPGAAALTIYLTTLLGDLEAAQQLAESAVSQHPNNPELQFRLAQVLINLGRHDAALIVAERALLLSPRPDGELWRDLAGVFEYLGNSARAKDLLLRARKVGADIFETAFTMLRAHVNLSDLDAAKQELATITDRWGAANLTYLRVLFQHYRDPEFEVRMIAPFAKAGMPEWPYDVSFDEAKRVSGEELAALFKAPYTIEGAVFTVTEIKGDRLCISRSWQVMGRAYCTPVYRDPDYVKNHTNTSHDLIAPSIHYSRFNVFSVRRGK